MTVPDAARQFTSFCEAELDSRLVAVLLEGSFARGDSRNDSDIDLFLLVDSVDPALLEQVGSIVSRVETSHELNPAVVSVAELLEYPELFGYVRVKLDGVVLYGALPTVDLPAQTESDIAKRIAQEVLMSSRHYLSVSEPEEKFAAGKLYHWNLKPLGFALRFFHIAQTGRHVRSVRELADLYPVLKLDPVRDWRQVLHESARICDEIIRTQPGIPRDAL